MVEFTLSSSTDGFKDLIQGIIVQLIHLLIFFFVCLSPNMTNLDSILKQRHHFANKGPSSQSYGFSSGHVWMWELDLRKAEHQRIDAFVGEDS